MSVVSRHITLDTYQHRYDCATLRREEGILEVRMHKKGDDKSPVVWSTYTHSDLSYLFYDISRDYDNECVILTGTGNTFIATENDIIPGDVNSGVDPLVWDEILHDVKHLHMNLLNIEVPVIAAINGPSIVHTELALLNDIVLASDDCSFQDIPHFFGNVVPGDSVQVVFPMLLGRIRANYFLLTGEKIEAKRAYELGLVNELLPKSELMARAWYWARFIAARSKLARRYTRAVLTQEWKKQMHEHLSLGITMEGLSIAVSQRMNNPHTRPNVPGHPYNKEY